MVFGSVLVCLCAVWRNTGVSAVSSERLVCLWCLVVWWCLGEVWCIYVVSGGMLIYHVVSDGISEYLIGVSVV